MSIQLEPNRGEHGHTEPDVIIDSEAKDRITLTRRGKLILRGGSLLVAMATAVGGFGYLVYKNTPQSIEFEGSKSVTAEPGQGLNDLAAQVDGISSVDIRDVTDHIVDDPANIDVMSNGQVDMYETFVIPQSVSRD